QWGRPQRFEQLGQRCAPQVGHTQRTQSAAGVVLNRVERDDVSMLQSRQRQVFAGLPGCELEDDRTIAQGELAGQENHPLRPLPQLGKEQEVPETVADGGKLWCSAARAQETLAVEEDFQLVAPLWKAA